mgnify:FL=1
MIRFLCPHCGSKLDAREEIAGQTRKCPKCRNPVTVPQPAGPSRAAEPSKDGSPAVARPPAEVPIRPPPSHPTRLVAHNRYLICDRSGVFAAWEGGGQGWLLRTDHGYTPVARNADKLPPQGDFKLVELQMSVEHERPLLRALRVFQLAKRWALVSLIRGDDAVLKTITGPGGLNRDQKNAIRQYLGQRMMREIWGDNQTILEYLANPDYHSPGAP